MTMMTTMRGGERRRGCSSGDVGLVALGAAALVLAGLAVLAGLGLGAVLWVGW